MNIKQLLEIINSTAEEILNQQYKYEFILKKLKLVLKKVHPDSGGDSQQFYTIQKLYSDLKKQSSLDVNEKILVQHLNDFITWKNSASSLTFEDYCNQIKLNFDMYGIKYKEYGLVQMKNLIDSKNRINNCQLEVNKSFTNHKIALHIYFDCVEYNGQHSTHEEQRTIDYCPSGKYDLTFNFQVQGSSIMKVRADGFDNILDYHIEKTGIFIKQLEQNGIILNIKLFVHVQ